MARKISVLLGLSREIRRNSTKLFWLHISAVQVCIRFPTGTKVLFLTQYFLFFRAAEHQAEVSRRIDE